MTKRLKTYAVAFALMLACFFCCSACAGGGNGSGTGGEKPEEKPQHTHTFSTEWESDATEHWHAATCEHTELKDSKAAHEFGEDYEYTLGGHYRKCTVCNRAEESSAHEYGEEYTFDENGHYRTCKVCGKEETKSDHVYEGVTCKVCGFELTETPDLSYKEISGGYEVTEYKGKSKIIIIPETYNGKPVIAVGANAFKSQKNITYVKIPDSVKTLGSYAFYSSGVSSMDIGNGLETVNDYAFGNTKLTEVTLPNSVKKIGTGAFYYAGYLKRVKLPQSLVSVPKYTFRNCVSLESVDMPAVTEVCLNAFENAEKFDMDVSKLTKIDSFAFQNSGLTEVTLNAVNAVVINQYGGMTNGEQNIGNDVFSDCKKLKKVTLGDKVEKLYSMTFAYCSALEEINIGNGLKTMARGTNYSGVFAGCNARKKLTVGANNTHYKAVNNALVSANGKILYLANAQAEIPAGVTQIEEAAFEGLEITEITIPDTVTTLRAQIFKNSTIESITIGSGVKDISSIGLFYGCNALTSITVKSANTTYKSAGNCILNAAGTIVVAGCKTSTIPSGVISIGDGAFMGCKELTETVLPSGVEKVGENAFFECYGLKKVTLPASVKEFSYYAFGSCKELADIEYNGTVSQWNAVKKAVNWANQTGEYTVRCTDGNINKS